MRATPSSPRSRDDVGRAELARELLPRLVTAHRDDPLRAHLLRREHAEQADRAVADDDDGRARLDVRRVGGEPAGAHHVGQREQARDQVVRRHVGRRDERAVGERDAQAWRLRADDRRSRADRRSGSRARQCGQVLSEAKNEPMTNWPGLNRRDGAADLLDDAAVLVAHRRRLR